MQEPTLKDVDQWIQAVEGELEDVGRRIQPLEGRKAALSDRLLILQRLRSSLAEPASANDDGRRSRPVAAATYPSIRKRIQAQALSILRESGRPMHINDLHAAFLKRGYEVPGAGRPNNITVHLASSDEISSPNRGYYLAKKS